jgi:hypothetical protein
MKANTLAIAHRIYCTPERVYGREELCVIVSVAFNMAKIVWCSDGKQSAKELRDLRPEE